MTRWGFTFPSTAGPDHCPGNLIVLPQTPPCAGEGVPASSVHCGPHLVGQNVPVPYGNNCLVSQLDVVVNDSLDGMVVTCEDMTTVPPAGATALTVRIVGK